jgi:hypothetical protein
MFNRKTTPSKDQIDAAAQAASALAQKEGGRARRDPRDDPGVVFKRRDDARVSVADPEPAPIPPPLHIDPEIAPYLTPDMNEVVTRGWLQGMLDALVEELVLPMQGVIKDLRRENQTLKLALADLKGQLAETTAKSSETSFVVARLRLDHKGDTGPQGLMGRDGDRGPPGSKGDRGPRGQPGDRIVSWRLSPETFQAYPITEQGKELPALNLMPFFATYNEQTEASEVDLAAEQEGFARDRLQLEIERVRRGLPAR